MISRGSSVGAVCLRCRLKLLRQLPPIRYVSNDASAINPFRDIERAASQDSGHNTSRDHGRDKEGTRDFELEQALDLRGKRQKNNNNNKMRYKRLDIRNKRHVSGNRFLNEASASLGLNMLGKPAYAIVMKDGGNIRKGQKLLGPLNISADKVSRNVAQNLEALLDSQRELPTYDEVRSNIQDLRPQDNLLSQKEYRKLQHQLSNGFLASQLQDYMEWHKEHAGSQSQEAVADAPSQLKYSWCKKITSWMPLRNHANSLLGYGADNAPPKDTLATRLMRECWGLSVAELGAGLGETIVKIRDHEFTLLMRGTQRFMETLGKVHLEQGEKIEAVRNQQALRLVTTKSKAEILIRALDEILQGVTTKTFPLRLVSSDLIEDNILEEVGLLTNSLVRKSHTLRRLHVTWIQVKSRAEKGLTAVEDIAHIVLRFLLTVSGSQQPTSTLLSSIPRESDRTGQLIRDFTCKDKLVWKDRLAHWARYVFPVKQGETVTETELPIKEFPLPLEPLTEVGRLKKDELEVFPENQFPAHPVKWSNTLQTSTVAHFGQILHPYNHTTPITPSDIPSGTGRHIFAPRTPHPVFLSKFETADDSSPLVITKITLLLRFWPSPSSNPVTKGKWEKPPQKVSPHAGDTPPAPILELRLAMSDTGLEGVESLRAIKRTHHTDVMLPSSQVDVRFVQTQYETMQARDRATLAAWQPISDFLQHAHLDFEKGKLEVPPRQRFPIPRRLFTDEPASSSEPLEDKPPQAAEETDDLVSTSYEFVGLELHRSASVPVDGQLMTYTSIEAGRGGGRRAEITLEPLTSSSTPSGDTAQSLQADFVDSCSRLVNDRRLWSGLPPKRNDEEM